jgi:hypothetical protein
MGSRKKSNAQNSSKLIKLNSSFKKEAPPNGSKYFIPQNFVKSRKGKSRKNSISRNNTFDNRNKYSIDQSQYAMG